MADNTSIKVDFSTVNANLDALAGPFRESLCRRMLVEGGVLLRDAAAANARIADNKEGVERRGKIASAIYLARDEAAETETFFQYRVSWNHQKAPHAHFFEYGWIRPYKSYKGSDGEWYTAKVDGVPVPLAGGPRREPARPFLRPAWDGFASVAIDKMLERGKAEFPKLLAEYLKT